MEPETAAGGGLRFLLTTEFVYWHLRGRQEAVRLMKALASAGKPCISAVSVLELQMLAADQPPEGVALIEALPVVALTGKTAARAAELLRNDSLGLDSTQAQLVATCLEEGLVLVHTWPERVGLPGLLEVSL